MIQHNKYQEDNQSNRTGQIIKTIIQENFPEIKKNKTKLHTERTHLHTWKNQARMINTKSNSNTTTWL